MKKFIVVLIVLAVVVFGGAQIVLPGFVQKQLEAQIGGQLQAESVNLHVESSPALRLALGDVDVFRGDLENVKLGTLNFADIHFDIANMQLDPVDLLMNRRVTIKSLGSGEIEGTVTQNDLQHFLEANVKGLNINQVIVKSDGLEIVGTIDIGVITGTADIKGRLELNQNQLQFSPQRFEINGAGIGGLNAGVLKPIAVYDFGKFPIPVTAQRLDTENGEIHVYVSPVSK